MNTSTMNETGAARRLKFLSGILAAGLLLGLTACRTTHQTRGSVDGIGILEGLFPVETGHGRRSQAGSTLIRR